MQHQRGGKPNNHDISCDCCLQAQSICHQRRCAEKSLSFKSAHASRTLQTAKEDLKEDIHHVKCLALTWRQKLSPYNPPSQTQPSRVAADCARYGSEIIALRLLGLIPRTQLVMRSENFHEKQAYHHAAMEACNCTYAFAKHAPDTLTKDVATLPPADLYVAGYPCPSCSRLGCRRGMRDGRHQVTLKHCLQQAQGLGAGTSLQHFVPKVFETLVLHSEDFGGS